MIRSQLNSYSGADPIWGFVALIGSERYTGEAAVGIDPRVRLFAVDGRVYFAEREGDAPIGTRLVNCGAVSPAQLEAGAVQIGETSSLARLFQRQPAVDRDAVELTIELATESLLESVANKAVGMPEVFPLRHHSSGVHHWLRAAAITPASPSVEAPAMEAPMVEAPVVEAAVVEAPVEDLHFIEELPVVEAAIVEAPPVAEELPVAEEVIVEEAVIEELPVVEEDVMEEAVIEEAIAEEAVIEDVVAEEAIVEELPVVEEAVIEEAIIEEAIIEEAVIEEAVIEETLVEELPELDESLVAEEVAVEQHVDIEEPVTESEVELWAAELLDHHAPTAWVSEPPADAPIVEEELVAPVKVFSLPTLGSFAEPVVEQEHVDEGHQDHGHQDHSHAAESITAEIHLEAEEPAVAEAMLAPMPTLASLTLPTLQSASKADASAESTVAGEPKLAGTDAAFLDSLPEPEKHETPNPYEPAEPPAGLPKLASAPISMNDLAVANAVPASPFGDPTHNLAAVDIWEMVDVMTDDGHEGEQVLVGGGRSEKQGRSWLRGRKS